jgi:hypothetical protein
VGVVATAVGDVAFVAAADGLDEGLVAVVFGVAVLLLSLPPPHAAAVTASSATAVAASSTVRIAGFMSLLLSLAIS